MRTFFVFGFVALGLLDMAGEVEDVGALCVCVCGDGGEGTSREDASIYIFSSKSTASQTSAHKRQSLQPIFGRALT